MLGYPGAIIDSPRVISLYLLGRKRLPFMIESDFNPLAVIEVSRAKLVIPAFSYAVTWLGMAERMASCELGNENPFSIKRDYLPDDTFVLAISWLDEDSVTHRYKFWDCATLLYPLYEGQRLGPESVLEIWSIGDINLSSTGFSLYTSNFVQPNLVFFLPVTQETTLTLE